MRIKNIPAKIQKTNMFYDSIDEPLRFMTAMALGSPGILLLSCGSGFAQVLGVLYIGSIILCRAFGGK